MADKKKKGGRRREGKCVVEGKTGAVQETGSVVRGAAGS